MPEAIPPEATQARQVHLWGQEGASWNQEATQARQRSRPQVHFGNKKVHLWGQEATQARQQPC